MAARCTALMISVTDTLVSMIATATAAAADISSPSRSVDAYHLLRMASAHASSSPLSPLLSRLASLPSSRPSKICTQFRIASSICRRCLTPLICQSISTSFSAVPRALLISAMVILVCKDPSVNLAAVAPLANSMVATVSRSSKVFAQLLASLTALSAIATIHQSQRLSRK